jgi:hypothetical protein
MGAGLSQAQFQQRAHALRCAQFHESGVSGGRHLTVGEVKIRLHHINGAAGEKKFGIIRWGAYGKQRPAEG